VLAYDSVTPVVDALMVVTGTFPFWMEATHTGAVLHVCPKSITQFVSVPPPLDCVKA
jgi:hypothetical protein